MRHVGGAGEVGEEGGRLVGRERGVRMRGVGEGGEVVWVGEVGCVRRRGGTGWWRVLRGRVRVVGVHRVLLKRVGRAVQLGSRVDRSERGRWTNVLRMIRWLDGLSSPIPSTLKLLGRASWRRRELQVGGTGDPAVWRRGAARGKGKGERLDEVRWELGVD